MRLKLFSAALLSLSLPVGAGELMLFVNPSIREIRWNSPASALRTSGWSQIHNIISHENPATVTAAVGHVVVHFRCIDRAGKRHEIWTGMTGQNDSKETKVDLIDDAIGIGVLFKPYKDGAIDPSEKSRNQVANYYGRLDDDSALVFGRKRVAPKFLRVPVDAGACERLVDFHQTFKKLSYDKKKVPLDVQRAKPDHEILSFGFTIDPYKAYLKLESGEEHVPLGGGCSSFALAFLKLSGNFDSYFERKFVRKIEVSEKLIGGAYGRIPGNRVSALDVAYGRAGRSWTVEGFDNRTLRFYDVQLIWNFIADAQACVENPNSRDCPEDVQSWLRTQDEVKNDTYSFDATRTEIRRTALASTRGGAPVTFKKEEVTRKVRATRNGIRLGF